MNWYKKHMWTPYNKAPSRKINLKVFRGAKMGLKHKNFNFFLLQSFVKTQN